VPVNVKCHEPDCPGVRVGTRCDRCDALARFDEQGLAWITFYPQRRQRRGLLGWLRGRLTALRPMR
jgi:hypothetical protein